jgi:hypothetical protein
VISPGRLGELPAALESLKQDSDTFRSNIGNLREKYFFDIGNSAEQGGKALVDIASNQNT